MEDEAGPLPWRAHTAGDVALLLNVSTKQVYRLARNGELPSFWVGRHLRFSDSAVRKFAGQAPADAAAVA